MSSAVTGLRSGDPVARPAAATPASARRALLGVGAVAALAATCLVWSAVLLTLSPRAIGVLYVVILGVLGATPVVAAAMVAIRRGNAAVAVLLALIGLVPCLIAVSDTYDAVLRRAPHRLAPPSPYWEAFGQGAWMLWYLPVAFLLLLFPDGRLPGPRWRIPAVALAILPVVFDVDAAFDPSPYPAPYQHVRHPFPAPSGGFKILVDVVGVICLLGLLTLLFVSVAAVVVRFRRAAALQRQQLKWFVLGAGFLPTTLLLCWFSYLVLDGPDLVLVGLAAMFLAIPAATAIALLRHDLYDVDRALSAATTYALVTAALLALFTVASFAGGILLGHRSPVIAAAATAICAATLAPLRTRLRRSIDRRLNPVRQRVLESVDVLLAGTHAGAARPEQIVDVLAEALQDPGLRVAYRLPGASVDIDLDGNEVQPLPDVAQTPIELGGERVGLLLTTRSFSRVLLHEVAEAAALLVEVARLRIGLGDALREVEDSRSRLVSTGYAERRRLEQDLHDGAQQRLVALGMQLRVSQRHLDDGTVDVDGLIEDAVAELGSAVAELREIAHGLRPASLDDGLGPALTTLMKRVPIPVALDIAAGAMPADVATTAYYVASEAVTNAIKHGSAARIALAVHHHEDTLRVRVSDDGVGGAQLRTGAGLSGLADRVAAAGGLLRVESPSGRGTVIEAVLPCAS